MVKEPEDNFPNENYDKIVQIINDIKSNFFKILAFTTGYNPLNFNNRKN